MSAKRLWVRLVHHWHLIVTFIFLCIVALTFSSLLGKKPGEAQAKEVKERAAQYEQLMEDK